jgi:hypothetical protein
MSPGLRWIRLKGYLPAPKISVAIPSLGLYNFVGANGKNFCHFLGKKQNFDDF